MKVQDQILLYDAYASQRFWSPRNHRTIWDVAYQAGVSVDGAIEQAWGAEPFDGVSHLDIYEYAAEIAQRLREGWRP